MGDAGERVLKRDRKRRNMAIQESVKKAQVKAASEAVKNGLETHRGSLVALDEVLQEKHIVEGVLTSHNGRSLLVLPVYTQNQVDLEESFVHGVKHALRGYRPKETELGGYAAFEISTSSEKRAPRKLKVYAGDVSFNMDIIKQDVNLEGIVSKGNGVAHKKSRKKEFDTLPESEWYQPDVKRGFEFDVTSDTPSSEKYNLIVLRSDVSLSLIHI